MENEISSGTKLGIVLIALAAIIGLGFGVFSIAKGTANEGVTSVQENLNIVGDSAFSDYDQRIVTGTQVLSAYQNFAGKNYCILIATNATMKKGASYTGGDGVSSAYSGKRIPAAEATETTPKVAYFINYNALLSGATMTATDTGTAKIKFDSNCYRTEAGFNTTSGAVDFNNISANLSKSGMMEYVPSNAKFQAYLVKDASGTIMGIAFYQIKA